MSNKTLEFEEDAGDNAVMVVMPPHSPAFRNWAIRHLDNNDFIVVYSDDDVPIQPPTADDLLQTMPFNPDEWQEKYLLGEEGNTDLEEVMESILGEPDSTLFSALSGNETVLTSIPDSTLEKIMGANGLKIGSEVPKADCPNCEYRYIEPKADQHCYMFLYKPGPLCGQFKERKLK